MRIVVLSFRVTVLLESVCVSDTPLISMAGHDAPDSWRVAQARQRQLIRDNRVETTTKGGLRSMRGLTQDSLRNDSYIGRSSLRDRT